MRELTPAEIVSELDRYIVGQQAAKRAVAIALRNRWRWQRLPDEVRRDITPRNILMIGPTGVGKTEITRRLASLIGAPFLKVEATKYTEVGYYGRDVETIIRDLVDVAVTIVRERKRGEVEAAARQRVEERLVGLLLRSNAIDDDAFNREGEVPAEPGDEDMSNDSLSSVINDDWTNSPAENSPASFINREDRIRERLRNGQLEDRTIELHLESRFAPVQVLGAVGSSSMDLDLQNMLEQFSPKQSRRRVLKVSEARPVLLDEEVEALTDRDAIHEEALKLAESSGVVFIDEIDKVCSPAESSRGPDVSRQGVQRDLLPIVEGTTVQTRYGHLKTDFMLFIAAGAFHASRPSDLMPELQGRFPIRVELSDLKRDDFVRILTEPKNSLVKQYQALLAVENVTLEFLPDAIEALADVAWQVNQSTQNIGARRLHTIMERLVEEISFDAPSRSGETIRIDAAFVRLRLSGIADNEDLSQFVL